MAKSHKKWIILGIIVLAVLIVTGWLVGSYNRFTTLDQNVESKWSEVENQYQRQADLIPNLISTVSSAVSVETKFVKDVIAARTSWQAAQSQLGKDTAGVQMNNGLSAFVNAVAEDYPELKANTQYVALTDELSGTQNRITTARGRYIESTQLYNTAIKRFPGKLLAGLYGFTEREYYEAEEGSVETAEIGSGQLPY